MPEISGTTRPGGRTARTRDAVHLAVKTLLGLRPEEKLTIADVAEQSAVHAATIYRRWGSIEALMLDVVVQQLNEDAPMPATGNLEQDLRSYGRRLVHSVDQPSGTPMLRALLAVAANPTAGHPDAVSIIAPRLELFAEMTGQDPDAGLTAIDIVDGLLAPIYFRAILATEAKMTGDDVDRLVDNMLAAGRARGSGRND